MQFLIVSRLTSVAVFLAVCAALFLLVWVGGQKAGEFAAKALEELFVGWLPGSQIPVVRGIEEKIILGSLQRGLIDLARDGMSWLFVGGALTFSLVWGQRCTKTIGSAGNPACGILVRTGRGVQVLGPGGIVFTLRPIEDLVLIPTGQYKMKYRLSEGLYSKENEEKGRSPQPLEVEVAVYLRFPQAKEVYDGVSGAELLLRLFYGLPGSVDLWDSSDGLGPFLEGAILGAVRQILSQHDHVFVREEKDAVEKEIKDYLLSEPGNPIHELGIPSSCLDVELVSVKLRLPAEEALMEPELARYRAAALRQEAEGEAAAAVGQRIAASELLAAYTGAGVPPDIAALVVSGAARGSGGGESGLGALRDLAIIRMAAGSSEQGGTSQRRGRRR